MESPDTCMNDWPARRGLLAGIWAALPVLLAVGPFGIVFGTLATEAGLKLDQTMVFTSLVVAGASQLASLHLMSEGAPAAVAILTGVVVNLRMAMYSASIAMHWQGMRMAWRVPAAFFLHDQAFALSMRRYTARPDEPLGDRLGFYLGIAVATIPVWIGMTWIGAEIGGRIPEGWGLEFAAPICFIAVVAPMIRGTANIVAAITSAVLATACAGFPGGSGLIVAAFAGILTGMVVARRMATRNRITEGAS